MQHKLVSGRLSQSMPTLLIAFTRSMLGEPPHLTPSAPQLALAIDKCLVVTGEVGVTPRLPPPPLLSSLQSVNDNSNCHDPQPVRAGSLWFLR